MSQKLKEPLHSYALSCDLNWGSGSAHLISLGRALLNLRTQTSNALSPLIFNQDFGRDNRVLPDNLRQCFGHEGRAEI